jgi:prepilin-type processing-associated H-X9-DG protein
MKIFVTDEGTRAFTRGELLAVVGSVALLAFVAAGLLLPSFARYGGGPVNTCANNLRQIGNAFRTWEADHGDLYPMSYFTNEAGPMKYAEAADAFRYFQVMSNELNLPGFLVCPADKTRRRANDFGKNFNGKNISYFIGLDTDETHPERLLSGDRNLTNGMRPVNGILNVTTNQTVGWTMERHQGLGNILFSDGSVQQFSAQGLKAAVAKTGLATNKLEMP